MFFNRIRYFNKYILNRLMLRFAGSSRSQFATIRHVGRHSGKSYETPIIVMPMGEDFVIALTYGPKVDWYRNLLAAEQGTLLWHGKTYTIGKPESIDRTIALPAFPLQERVILRLLGNLPFVCVKSSTSLTTKESQ
jgi:deazaflavin-dependent oxidoreductase (nitroreductase family)